MCCVAVDDSYISVVRKIHQRVEAKGSELYNMQATNVIHTRKTVEVDTFTYYGK